VPTRDARLFGWFYLSAKYCKYCKQPHLFPSGSTVVFQALLWWNPLRAGHDLRIGQQIKRMTNIKSSTFWLEAINEWNSSAVMLR
jgi:hypothetical protein